MLVSIGVVVGVWQWLGNGYNPTDGPWLDHAAGKIEEFGQWANGVVTGWLDRIF